MTLAQRQRKSLDAQRERDLGTRQRSALRELRTRIRAAKARRRTKVKDVRCDCKAARLRNRARAKKARERLNASIRRTREHARTVCSLAVGEAQRSTLHDISRAVDALTAEQSAQRQLAVWTKPKRSERSTRLERRQESDDEVLANIEEPGLRVVFQEVKGKIKAGPRRSRTEAFYEWVGEHSADVYRIQERDAERAIVELERAERKLAKARGKKSIGAALEAVPF